jgi:hypothetical protein
VQLPGGDDVDIDPAKVRDYLLSPAHPVGLSKARVFGRLGFVREDWLDLRHHLASLARTGEASLVAANTFGQKYIVVGIIQGPNGRRMAVTTVWIISRGTARPRFVTAYPGDRR